MTYDIILFADRQPLPIRLTLTSVSVDECRDHARFAMARHRADYAEISDGDGHTIDMVIKADRNPHDDRSSVDWGDIVLPSGEVPLRRDDGLG